MSNHGVDVYESCHTVKQFQTLAYIGMILRVRCSTGQLSKRERGNPELTCRPMAVLYPITVRTDSWSPVSKTAHVLTGNLPLLLCFFLRVPSFNAPLAMNVKEIVRRFGFDLGPNFLKRNSFKV